MSIRVVTYLLFGVLSAALAGCVSFEPGSERTVETFPRALRICRLQQPGRTNRRVHLPPTHGGVAHCLRNRGWNPDGSRVLHTPAAPKPVIEPKSFSAEKVSRSIERRDADAVVVRYDTTIIVLSGPHVQTMLLALARGAIADAERRSS